MSYAQCVRFADSAVFEQLFTQVLASCRQAGLLDGRRLVVDATHVETDAALSGRHAELHAAPAADEDEPPAGPLESGGAPWRPPALQQRHRPLAHRP